MFFFTILAVVEAQCDTRFNSIVFRSSFLSLSLSFSLLNCLFREEEDEVEEAAANSKRSVNGVVDVVSVYDVTTRQ